MAAGFAMSFQGLAMTQMLFGGGMDWKCFASGFIAGLAPLTVAVTSLGLSLKDVVGLLITGIGVAEAVFDATGSRESCMRL